MADIKLGRIEASARQQSAGVAVPSRRAEGDAVRQVTAAAAAADHRERSLQQELDEFEQEAIGPFEGGERLRQEAHALAGQLAALGPDAEGLIKVPVITAGCHPVDEEA